MGGVFTASLKRIEKLLPSGCRPLMVAPDTVLACVFCLEHRESPLGPYNEAIVGVLLTGARGSLLGPLEALKSLVLGKSEVFICQLPVSLEAARKQGVRLFGFPKFTAEIVFRETATHRICTLRDKASLELILEFDLKKMPTRSFWTRFSRKHTVRIFAPSSNSCQATAVFSLQEWGASFLLPSIALRWGRSMLARDLKLAGWGVPLLAVHAPRARLVLRSEKTGRKRAK